MARNILSWVVMYLCNLIGAELSMQDGELFHSFSCSWICEYLGKANSLSWKSKSKSCNFFQRAKPFERISVERPALQLPSSTSSFHGLLSELERPELHKKTNEKQTRKTSRIFDKGKRPNGSMFDVSAVLMENLTWTETVVDCTRACYPYHNHFARSAKVYRMQQTYANMSKDGNKTCIVILWCTYIMHTVHKDTDIVGR